MATGSLQRSLGLPRLPGSQEHSRLKVPGRPGRCLEGRPLVQLKERNDTIDQQLNRRDVHAAAAQRPTFEQTFDCQMSALDSKLRRLDR
eukprot:scaffold10425_cov114-Isochrysis_galbana.AAC.4